MARLSDIISTPDLAGYVRDSEAITWAETQTFNEPIENVNTRIKHNNASFEANGVANVGMPADWTCVKTTVTDGYGTGDRFTVTHNKGFLFPALAVRTSVGKFASVTANTNGVFSVDIWIPESTGYERAAANCYISVCY